VFNWQEGWKLARDITAIQLWHDHSKGAAPSKQTTIYEITRRNSLKPSRGDLTAGNDLAEKRPLAIETDTEQSIFPRPFHHFVA